MRDFIRSTIPTSQMPACRASSSARPRFVTRATGTTSAAPAETRRTAAVTLTERCEGITIPAKPGYLVLARLALSAVCRLTPLDSTEVADLKLAVTEAGNVFPLPEGWSYEKGAALPVVYATAYAGFVIMGGLRKGDRALIHAAAGGVGACPPAPVSRGVTCTRPFRTSTGPPLTIELRADGRSRSPSRPSSRVCTRSR